MSLFDDLEKQLDDLMNDEQFDLDLSDLEAELAELDLSELDELDGFDDLDILGLEDFLQDDP